MKHVEIKIKAEELKKKLNVQDGKTPVKGVDYSDGYTPVKDVDYCDGSPDTPKEIKEKLESLKGDKRLDIKALKGTEELAEKKSLDLAITALYQRTQFSINQQSVKSVVAGTNITIDNTDTSNPIISSSGGGAVSSVANSDGTLTISPTTGAVVASRPAITGDVSVPGASNTATLATVNSNVGTFTNATVTVNAKGLVTAASTGSAGGSVTIDDVESRWLYSLGT